MIGSSKIERLWQQSLRARITLLVIITILPIVVLSMWQGFDRIRTDQRRIADSLLESVFRAASDEQEVFVRAEETLKTLAEDKTILSGATGCGHRLAAALQGQQGFANLARISADAKLLCSAIPTRAIPDFRTLPWWNEAKTNQKFKLSGVTRSWALNRDVFLGVLPVANTDGKFHGTINVALDISWLTFVHAHQSRLAPGSIVAVFDKSGAIAISNEMNTAKRIFSAQTPHQNGSTQTQSKMLSDGTAWTFAFAPILRRDYYVGLAMPNNILYSVSYTQLLFDLLIPLLLIVATYLALWCAIDTYCIRWIGQLKDVATKYSTGTFSTPVGAFDAAPTEFREIGNILNQMGRSIEQKNASLVDVIAHKDELIREVHHRVKNTLQIVLSLLSLQSHDLQDPNARKAIEQARQRISALALAKRKIGEQETEGSVNIQPLLVEAVGQAQRHFEAFNSMLDVSINIAQCQVDKEFAIPLTLFTNEAMTSAIEQTTADADKTNCISVSLQPSADGFMRLVVATPATDLRRLSPANNDDMSPRLMKALAQQVAGTLSIGADANGATNITLQFLNYAPAARKPPFARS